MKLTRESKWMEGSGPYADIVISSRIRLARNFEELPFPHLLSEAQQKKVVDKLQEVVSSPVVQQKVGRLELIILNELTPLQRQILVEKHLISPELAAAGGYKGVVLREDDAVSIMINEEDHLRIQSFLPALQLVEAWRLASFVDDVLEGMLKYAFSEEYGYLTSCPTNVGTGLRASVMMHLPALVLTDQARRVLSALPRVGLVVRGLYGEGTEAVGNLFQISNQLTLGQTEEEIITNLSSVTKHIIDQEKKAREKIMKEDRGKLEDQVYRAYGILTSARVISSQEALTLLSKVRLGIDLKIIKNIDPRKFVELLVKIQPAYLQVLTGREMDYAERDWKRAAVLRETLGVK
ncbi:protein arginine kinase [Calderihabitans maritimus]|uniref:Protein-arginine kinase n=1 Tax=Calderihabitans maritimus TaxID=1246530 RepID=A0A1Z5HNP2_9FIRM|nr:protein arginine kinase [Calderihabitans maritimus]GAW91146.1 ATP:guanido phosphotransferase [Calderihabitans maritimus]